MVSIAPATIDSPVQQSIGRKTIDASVGPSIIDVSPFTFVSGEVRNLLRVFAILTD